MNFFEKLKNFFGKIREWWKGLTPAQKVLFGGSFGAVIIAIVVGIIFAANPPYALLIGGISDEEAGNITTKLDEMGIPYKVGPGNRIYIPVKYNVYEVRMKLASSGVLGSTSKGFELVEESGLGATSFDRQVRYQIALQNELAKTIVTMKGVRAARVHLVLPKFTYYVRGEVTEPRASVFVELEPGVELTTEQIKGIMELVAGAVEGLKLENVKVVDQYSRVLSDRVVTQGETMIASSKMELKMKLEEYYRDKIKKPLEKLFGMGNVEVIADVKLNWDKLEKELKRYEAPSRKGGLLRSEQVEQEKSTNLPPGGGAVGTESNIPPGYQYLTGSGTSTYERNSYVKNYELNEIYEKLTQNKEGEIEGLSVSVMIDASSANLGRVDENTIKEWEEKVKDLLLAGISASSSPSNMKVSVAFLPFDKTFELEVQKQLEELRRQEKFRLLAIGLFLITIIGFLLIYLIMLQVRKIKMRKIVEARKAIIEEEIRKLLEEEVKEEEVEEVPETMKELQELKEGLEKIFAKDPSQIAYVIKLWISSSS